MKSFILVEERTITCNMDKVEASKPILIDDLTLSVKNDLINGFRQNGFVIFETTKDIPASDLIMELVEELHLGGTYVTGYNQNKFSDMFKENRLNTITNTKKGNHVVFDNSNAQGLHSDATFEPIGKVPSTILYCEQEALVGGDTILFDSVRAFQLLQQFNSEWAEAMLHPESLRRRSILGDTVEAVEPAFKILPNGEIISRFTVDTSSDWEYGFERVPHLEKAFGFMTALIPRGSGFSTILKLNAKQGILFANDKIAHGRTAFTDDENNPRKMIRGLYLERPSLDQLKPY